MCLLSVVLRRNLPMRPTKLNLLTYQQTAAMSATRYLAPRAANRFFEIDHFSLRMAALVKSTALQNAYCCTCEEMLRQQ